jgi:alpha-glucosidase
MRHTSRYARKSVARWVPNERYQPQGPVDLGLGARRARAAALLMLALPGGAYICQGEELGLPAVEDLPESVLQDPIWERSGHTDKGRDGCRVPIPWSGQETPFGFSPQDAYAGPRLPQTANWNQLTVEAQTGHETSVLELHRTALRIRRDHDALGDGTMTWLDTPAGVPAFRRDPGFVCLVHLSSEAYPLPEHTATVLASSTVADGLLEPDHAVWLRG